MHPLIQHNEKDMSLRSPSQNSHFKCEKASDESELREILQTIRPVLLTGVNIMKDKERMGNGHRWEVTKINVKIKATWYPELDPGTEK